MTAFYGKHTSKLDDKGRLVFPKAFKEAMPEGSDMEFVVRKDIFVPCLEIYPRDEWERQVADVRSRLNFFNVEHAMFWRAYMQNCVPVKPDEKFGRITISKELLELIGVTKEVEFVGNGFKIEVWAKENYESSKISNEQFIAIAGKLPDAR